MPPKNAPSKKVIQKEKQKKIEELTFGLKNKNKSAKVQQYVQSMEKNVLNTGTNPRQRQLEEQKKQAKLAAKAAKKALEAERDALFNEALLAVSKKAAHDAKAGKIESKGRDADDNEAKKQTSSAMKMMYQMDATEMRNKLHEDVSIFFSMLRTRGFCFFASFLKTCVGRFFLKWLYSLTAQLCSNIGR